MSRMIPPLNPYDILVGWEAIAEEIGTSTRTARRWALTGPALPLASPRLPVYKPRGRVYALRSEIRRWLTDAIRGSRVGGP